MSKKQNTEEDIEIRRGSTNVFADFGMANADLLKAKALLAAKIIGTLDKRKWTAVKAAKETGFSKTDFSRIRNANLTPFTLDRMIKILSAIDAKQEVVISVQRRPAGQGRRLEA